MTTARFASFCPFPRCLLNRVSPSSRPLSTPGHSKYLPEMKPGMHNPAAVPRRQQLCLRRAIPAGLQTGAAPGSRDPRHETSEAPERCQSTGLASRSSTVNPHQARHPKPFGGCQGLRLFPVRDKTVPALGGHRWNRCCRQRGLYRAGEGQDGNDTGISSLAFAYAGAWQGRGSAATNRPPPGAAPSTSNRAQQM